MIRGLKLILFFFVFCSLNQISFSKPLPPGSGSGDVPANILFLLDSSASMNRTIGAGIPRISSMTIDGDGNKFLTSVDRRGGGLFKFNSDGERVNISGTTDNGSTYSVWPWRATNATDRTCDFGLSVMGGLQTNVTVPIFGSFHEVDYASSVTVPGTTIDDDPLLFVGMYNNNRAPYIIGLDSNFRCRLVVSSTLNRDRIMGFDIAIKDSEPVIYFYGYTGRTNKGTFLATCSFANASCAEMIGRGRGRTDTFGRLWGGFRIRITAEATMMYMSQAGRLYGYQLPDQVNGLPTNTSTPLRQCTPTARVSPYDISSTDEDIFYGGDWNVARLNKFEWTDNRTCTILDTIGTFSNVRNSGDPGTIAADSIRMQGLNGVRVIGNRILYSSRSYVDELSESLWTDANRNTTWRNQVGGPKITRWTGAKDALTAVLSDSTLTSGANFGFGHWNAGHGNLGRRAVPFGGAWCHKDNNPCNYYGGLRPATDRDPARSNICTRNSCLNVGISEGGAAASLDVIERLGVEWGTDSEAFSQIAHDYFFNDFTEFDPDAECQLNYVIVIGDGEMTKTGTNGQRGRTAARLERLRQAGVQTLMVAYGGGIRTRGMNLFNSLARIGSCENAGDADCRPTIIANTPQELRTQLQSIIRQIIAEKLAFTAPSITATIQEGGSLYQAQFEYIQFGEWQGSIFRSELRPDKEVIQGLDHEGNWSSAVSLREQILESSSGTNDDGRNIWTVLPNISYLGNWNNFTTDDANQDAINSLMGRLNFSLLDYHNSSSECSTSNRGTNHPSPLGADVGQDGTADEVAGLINFIRGQDYFDYDGDCVINELRSHIQGDIYHSQLIEIGAPDASTQFTDNNQEGYFRMVNGYTNFKLQNKSRTNIIYAGSNSGVLHAINASTGREEWAFVPPFIAAKLPIAINPLFDGRGPNGEGGSNAMFGVDGSPVVHDVLMRGLDSQGELEDDPTWHTILFIPYGRGGSGFSVLDVTNPIVEPSRGPLHLFSVYNDYIRKIVYIADEEGNITERAYVTNSVNVEESREALRAAVNLEEVLTEDGFYNDPQPDPEVTDAQDARAACQTNGDATSGEFAVDGNNTCYIGSTFTFDNIQLDVPDGQEIDASLINVSKLNDEGDYEPLGFSSARMINGIFEITFDNDLIYNPGGSVNETRATDEFYIQTSCTAATGIPFEYDYSKLGETWSTPRIVRLPSDVPGEELDRTHDKYVAIMGAGLAATNRCAGSAVYLIELDDMENPARIYGAEQNQGPITIIDTEPGEISVGGNSIETPNGSNINNSVPTDPVVITPDTAFGVPWRGAMVYINDHEGKITKINLTDSTKHGARMFDQTTLFRLNANTANARYTFFSMDAGIGVTTKDFWLWGGTGNFNKLASRSRTMDNIIYGVRDRDYPFFKHLNGVIIPRETDPTFVEMAHLGANAAAAIDNPDGSATAQCKDVTGDADGRECPSTEDAWYIKLDQQDGLDPNDLRTVNSMRKASAPPTFFQGQVYFPIYEPPAGTGEESCKIGNAFICASDDECGTNNSHKLVKGSTANAEACTFVREGVLSELVVFDNTLFANVAGPSEMEKTLYKITAIAGEVLTNSGGWRDVGF